MTRDARIDHAKQWHGDIGKDHWRRDVPDIAVQWQASFYQAGLAESVDTGQLLTNNELMDGLGSFVSDYAFEV